MAAASDRKAALVLLLLAAAGLVVRFWQAPGASPGGVGYQAAGPRPARDSVAARALRLARPLARGEHLDLDRAGPEELARLPRVGPALAARIVADREAHGLFGSLQRLDRVPGIGPTLLEAIRPYAVFSGGPGGLAPSGSPLLGPPAVAVSALPLLGPPAPAASVSLNTASESDLLHLPGIGPGLARAIVADRVARGPFRTPDDLKRVRGIGDATLRALKGRIVVP